MPRPILLIGSLGGFILAIFLFLLNTAYKSTPYSPAVPSTASSTLSVVPNNAAPETVTSTVSTTHTTTTPMQKTHVVQKVGSVITTSTPPTAQVSFSTTQNFPQNMSFDSSANAVRNALVNILCYAPAGSNLHSISGSGIIIDPKGIILTNAHIGQYFLLADRGVSCSIRSGSPAQDRYTAKLIFISSAWVHANVGVLTEAAPTGSGEYDFAFLAVSDSVRSEPLPSTFPFIRLNGNPPLPGAPIVIASYAAQFLSTTQIQSALFPTVVFGSVKNVLTFNTNTIDVLALGGSAAAQEGSSGGGIADADGNLVGTITTSTVEGATDTRSLDAITTSYIRADYASETAQPLDLFLAEPTEISISAFAPKIPLLESVLFSTQS